MDTLQNASAALGLAILFSDMIFKWAAKAAGETSKLALN